MRKAEITVVEVAKIMKTGGQQVRYGMRSNTLPIGWVTKNENDRYTYHIVLRRFCEFMRMTEDEVLEKLDKIRQDEKNISTT